MSLTFIEQIKHDFNESHLKYYSILLNFDGVWDFAAAKAPKVGTKITQKGGRVITCDPARTYPCGAVCRSHNKDCSNPIEGQAKTYAGWLEKQAMTKYDRTVISLKKEIAFNTLSETEKLPKKGDSVYLIADVNRATGEPLLRDYIFVGLSKDKKTATLRPKSLTDDQKEIAKKNPSNFDRKVGADEVVVTDLTLDEAQKYFKEQNIASTTREREVREARSLKTENTKEINTVVEPRKPTKKDTPEPTIVNRRKLTELPVEWKNLDSRVKEDIERNNRTNWGDVKVGDRVFDTNTQKYVTVNRKFSRHANATTEDGQKVKLQDYSAKKKSFDDLVLDTVDGLQTKKEWQVKVDEKDKRPDSKVVEPTKKPQEQTDTKNKIISTDETLKDYATRLHGVDAALKKPEEIDAITKNYENAVISRIEKGDSIAPNLLRYGNLREYADKNGITDRLIDSVRKDVLGTYKPSARDLKDAAIGANKENPKSVDSQIKSLEESLAFQTYKNWQGSDPAKTKKQWEADLRYLTNVKNLQTAKSEPTKKPQEQTDIKKPDLKVVDDSKGVEPTKVLPKEEPKPLDDKYIPLPDKNQPFSLQESKDFYRSVLEGKVTPEHIKINWERFKDSKSTIEAELNSKTKAELSKMISSMYIRSDDKKADIVKRVLNDIETNFVPGSLAYNPFDKGSKEAALEKGVNEWTQDKIDANSAAFKATQKERIEKIAKISEAIKNPQTLEDFETKKQYAKDKTLTPEQQKLYDELVAQKNASQRKSEIEQKGKIEAIQNEGIKMSARQTKHTKTGEDLHVVSLDERVDRDTYNKLNERAKKLGGYYSAYNKGGAIPGFQFKDPDKAKEFMSLDELSKGSEKLQDKETKGSERLRAVADSLREDANERLNRDRLANTNRRARMAASAEDDARRDLFIADTMQNISDAITNGKAKYLGGINSKAQVEQLESILKQGHYDYARDKSNETNKYQQYQSYKQIAESPITDEAVTRAKFPYPQVRVGSMRDIIKQVKDKPGLKLLAQKMAKKLENSNSSGEYGVKFESEQDIEDLRTFLSKADRHIPKDWDMKEARAELQGYDRIRRTGITTPEELRTSLREYLGYRGTKQNADPIKKLERDLVGVKIEGYFPTPDKLAFDMVDKLDVKRGQKVLEPSAGKGSLADAVLSKYGADTKIDTIEVNSKLANLLKAKGYDPKQEDFLELKGVRYDRIIMNPPFERGQDMDHVRHAYDLLEPGGKIVAIMGEGGFFRSDSKSVEFRDWLNSRGGTSEKLPEGSFKTSDNPTGVNTRLVIIEKPGRRDFSEFTWSRENIEYFKNFKTPCRTILSY